MNLEHAIETASGTYFDFDCPRAQDVTITDVGRALANVARFGGHTRWRYSVAEHVCLVYRLVKAAGCAEHVCLAALHHDTHEAYVGDIPTPLKRKIKKAAPGLWEGIVEPIDVAIGEAFGVDVRLFADDWVKAADAQALGYEAAILKPSCTAQNVGVPDGWVKADPSEVPRWAVRGWTPEKAEQEFINDHLEACSR